MPDCAGLSVDRDEAVFPQTTLAAELPNHRPDSAALWVKQTPSLLPLKALSLSGHLAPASCHCQRFSQGSASWAWQSCPSLSGLCTPGPPCLDASWEHAPPVLSPRGPCVLAGSSRPCLALHEGAHLCCRCPCGLPFPACVSLPVTGSAVWCQAP